MSVGTLLRNFNECGDAILPYKDSESNEQLVSLLE